VLLNGRDPPAHQEDVRVLSCVEVDSGVDIVDC
jgi:hypothetical protein